MSVVGRMYQQQGCEVIVTGHSLGGYLAEVVATSLGVSPGDGGDGGENSSTSYGESLPGEFVGDDLLKMFVFFKYISSL